MKVDEITVKQLIVLLLDEPMNNRIVFRQGQKEIDNVSIISKKPEGLGALFG